MIFFAFILLGLYSFLNVPIELAPKEEYPQLDIQTTWSGVSPEIVESYITSLIEEKASTVKGVRKILSTSRIGYSGITLEFDPKTNMEFARLALREKISEIKEELPYRVYPRIVPYVPPDFQRGPFLHYTISGDYSLQELRSLVKDKLELGIGSIKGISFAEVTGGSDPEIRIVLDENKLKSLNIHPYLVRIRLMERAGVRPTGRVKKGDQELIFKVSDPIEDIADIGATMIRFIGGKQIRLREISDIYASYGDIQYINRINGQPTIRLTIRKESGTSTLKVARKVKQRLEELKLELPQDLTFRVVDDESEDILKNLRELFLLVGIIILTIFILVFLVLRSVKPSLLVLSSIIFSVLLTFNLIYLLKISINMLTLGGLALGFGLFVDNSIVVFENILRLREKGFSPFQAAVKGAKEVFLPVLAATLTTMSVFFSFAYFQGRLKIYYLPLAVVISSALAASLLVSFTFIPALSPNLLKRKKREKKERFRNIYERLLKVLIRYPVPVILVILLIFFGSYKWFRSKVTIGEWFGWDPGQELYVGIEMPPGTPIEWTDRVAQKFEEKVLEAEYEKELNTTVLTERAGIRIEFPPEVEYSYRPYLLKEELIQMATQFAGVGVYIRGFDPQSYASSLGSGTSFDSSIKFHGYNLKKLKEITSKLEETLRRNPRIKEIRTASDRFGRYFKLDSFEYVLRIDRKAVEKFDIDPVYLYSHISSLFEGRGYSPINIKMGSKETELSIKFPEAEKMELGKLQDALITSRAGELFRVGDITAVEERPIAGAIDREDQQYQHTIMWEFRGPFRVSDNYKKTVFSSLELPPGFTATIEDYGWWMTETEKSQMTFAIIFSLVIIFMILASLYESLIQPFFILLAVPLALIGVFAAFVLADFPFDSSAYIGVILLGGIVVNNSILLVDHINLKRKEGLPLLESVLKGARERIRPIFLTTSTTVLGMLPLVLIQIEVERRQIWSTLALSAVGGLISSTLFILIVIPIFYFYGDRIRHWIFGKGKELKRAWRNF
jgi:HAE1 family hydrophobic/amphiphilic exporter-1